MPIDDILREQGAMPTPEQQAQQQSQQESQTQTVGSPGTLQIEVPAFAWDDQEALLFWLNVAQTVAIAYLLLRG